MRGPNDRGPANDPTVSSASAAHIPHTGGKGSSRAIHFQLRTAMRLYHLALRMAGWMGRLRRPRPQRERFEILLTGTFFSDNWVRSHLLPLAASSQCARVRMVATVRVPDISKVEGVYPPPRLVKAVGSVPARLLYFGWVALRTRPDIVGGFHLLVNGLVATLVARLIGARAMYFCVGGPVELLDGGVWGENRIFARLPAPDAVVEGQLLDAVQQCDLVITMGHRAIEFFRGRGLTTRFHVVSGGIDRGRFFPDPNQGRDIDVILTCRLVPIKRVDLFLRTVQVIARELPSVRATIVGDGPLRGQMETLARQLGVDRAVSFIGQQADVENWLRRARVFVLTSDSEGLSLSLMEAMMTGLPAVVSAVGDLGDLVEDGVNGHLVAERTPEAFAEPLLRLLTDPARLASLSSSAARAGAVHAPDAVTRRWDEILGQLTGSVPSRPTAALALSRKNLWERLPRSIKTLCRPAIERVPPASLLGRQFRDQLRFVREAQWWSEERTRAHQVAELRRICTHASGAPYYQALFKECGLDPRDLKQPEDIRRLPLLERETLRDRLGDMCTIPAASRQLDYVSTGGSSGEPLRFYIDANRSAIEYAYLVASWSRAGFSLGMPLAVLRGRIVEPDASGFRHEYDAILRHHYYSSFHLTSQEIPRYLRHIATLGPCFLHVYPSSMMALVRYLQSSRETAPRNIRGILAESEGVTTEERRMVEELFGCRYLSSYGLTEKVVAAAGCEHSPLYHVWPTYGYFELVDDAGRIVSTPGERGEIVGTGFINSAVPFLRYRTGDYATYAGDRCTACGRAHTLISNIKPRRLQEWFVAANGSLIAWTALNMHDDTFEHVLRFQFLQVVPGRATLRVVPSSAFTEADVIRIKHNLDEKLRGMVELTVEVAPSIRLSESGKAIYIDQRLPIEP